MFQFLVSIYKELEWQGSVGDKESQMTDTPNSTALFRVQGLKMIGKAAMLLYRQSNHNSKEGL